MPATAEAHNLPAEDVRGRVDVRACVCLYVCVCVRVCGYALCGRPASRHCAQLGTAVSPAMPFAGGPPHGIAPSWERP